MASDDQYKTIAAPAQASIREHASRFLAFAWPVTDEQQVREHLDALRKEYHDATHICYAWRMGAGSTGSDDSYATRANDDGEPSGTAGRPILGQIVSRDLTNIFVAVVRYFGGTKLGVPGLIAAYRQAAADVLDAAEVVERCVEERLEVRFPYSAMNDVMRAVKDLSPVVMAQQFDNECFMILLVRRSLTAQLTDRMGKIDGATIK